MIGAVMENIIGGFLHPRASVRRLLAGEHGVDAAVAMVVLGYLVRHILLIMLPEARGGELEGSLIVWYFGQLVLMLFFFALLTGLVYGIGRMFNGAGSATESSLVVAWFLLITSVIEPPMTMAAMELEEALQAAESSGQAVNFPGGALFTAFAGLMIWLWLFASYVAELHRFASTWNVLGVMVGFLLLFAFLLTGLAPAA